MPKYVVPAKQPRRHLLMDGANSSSTTLSQMDLTPFIRSLAVRSITSWCVVMAMHLHYYMLDGAGSSFSRLNPTALTAFTRQTIMVVRSIISRCVVLTRQLQRHLS